MMNNELYIIDDDYSRNVAFARKEALEKYLTNDVYTIEVVVTLSDWNEDETWLEYEITDETGETIEVVNVHKVKVIE